MTDRVYVNALLVCFSYHYEPSRYSSSFASSSCQALVFRLEKRKVGGSYHPVECSGHIGPECRDKCRLGYCALVAADSDKVAMTEVVRRQNGVVTVLEEQKCSSQASSQPLVRQGTEVQTAM